MKKMLDSVVENNKNQISKSNLL